MRPTSIAPLWERLVAPPCAELAIAQQYPNIIQNCSFDKAATMPIIIFEIIVIAGTIFAFWFLRRFADKIWQRYLLVALGVLIFQLFTAPMWDNLRLGWWAYIYIDVSWILTVGWATLILSTIVLVDHFFARLKVWQRFGLYLVFLTLEVLVAEFAVVNLGIRTYAPEVEQALVGLDIIGVPIEVFYYVPVFMALVISFYKYWALQLDAEPIVPIKRRRWLATFGISVLGVFLFELMIEPMVINANLPAWSYVYRDVSFLMTGLWVLVIWLAVYIVDRALIHLSLPLKFLAYLGVVGIIVLPIESWLINAGYRVYGPSARANFTGIETVITDIPVEVAFAIPLYLALVIAFIRYWEIEVSSVQ